MDFSHSEFQLCTNCHCHLSVPAGDPPDGILFGVCPDCGMPHHVSCWKEFNTCGTLGCKQETSQRNGAPLACLQNIQPLLLDAAQLEVIALEEVKKAVQSNSLSEIVRVWRKHRSILISNKDIEDRYEQLEALVHLGQALESKNEDTITLTWETVQRALVDSPAWQPYLDEIRHANEISKILADLRNGIRSNNYLGVVDLYQSYNHDLEKAIAYSQSDRVAVDNCVKQMIAQLRREYQEAYESKEDSKLIDYISHYQSYLYIYDVLTEDEKRYLEKNLKRIFIEREFRQACDSNDHDLIINLFNLHRGIIEQSKSFGWDQFQLIIQIQRNQAQKKLQRAIQSNNYEHIIAASREAIQAGCLLTQLENKAYIDSYRNQNLLHEFQKLLSGGNEWELIAFWECNSNQLLPVTSPENQLYIQQIIKRVKCAYLVIAAFDRNEALEAAELYDETLFGDSLALTPEQVKWCQKAKSIAFAYKIFSEILASGQEEEIYNAIDQYLPMVQELLTPNQQDQIQKYKLLRDIEKHIQFLLNQNRWSEAVTYYDQCGVDLKNIDLITRLKQAREIESIQLLISKIESGNLSDEIVINYATIVETGYCSFLSSLARNRIQDARMRIGYSIRMCNFNDSQ